MKMWWIVLIVVLGMFYNKHYIERASKGLNLKNGNTYGQQIRLAGLTYADQFLQAHNALERYVYAGGTTGAVSSSSLITYFPATYTSTNTGKFSHYVADNLMLTWISSVDDTSTLSAVRAGLHSLKSGYFQIARANSGHLLFEISGDTETIPSGPVIADNSIVLVTRY